MKNVLNLFLSDLRKISKNVVALIIVVGISVLPCFYAWFNIAASWDPYGSTKDIKIAVSSKDEGYTGTLVPANVNIGETVLSKLHSNNKLGWTFVEEEEARTGVESGEYYAAIIIPEDFTKNMLSVFSDNLTNPSIEYYYNSKVNAISPKVTDKGSKTIKNKINQSFNETLDTVILSALKSLAVSDDETDLNGVAKNLLNNINQISSDLSMLSGTVNSFIELSESVQSLLETTEKFIGDAQSTVSSDSSSLSENDASLNSLESELNNTLSGLETALTNTQTTVKDMASSLKTSLDSASSDSSSLGDTLSTDAGTIESMANEFQNICDQLGSLKEQLSQDDEKATVDLLISTLSTIKNDLNDYSTRLNTAAKSCQETPEKVNSILEDLVDSLNKIIDQLNTNIESFKTDIKGKLTDLAQKIVKASNSLSTMLTNIDSSVTTVKNSVDSMSKQLSNVTTALKDTKKIIDQSLTSTASLQSELQKVVDSQDYDQIKKLLSGDTTSIAKFLSNPVELNTIKVFEVEKYGSAMAPFYTALSIWVGGIVLAAMLKTQPGKEAKKMKAWQFYLGRYLIFLLLGLVQTTLICLGDLYFLGIQCGNPFLFMVAGWLSSIVYVNIIYTLTVSFGDVGKAIAVILMVMQVAGSGGTFPIETTPQIFQDIFPFLPFGHTMDMMRECIGGFYGNIYIDNACILLVFLLVSLFFGIFLRKPILKLTNWVSEQLESTKLIE